MEEGFRGERSESRGLRSQKRVERGWKVSNGLGWSRTRSPPMLNSTFRKIHKSPSTKKKKKEKYQGIKIDFEQKGTFAGLGGHLNFYSTSDSLPTPSHRCSTFDIKWGAVSTLPPSPPPGSCPGDTSRQERGSLSATQLHKEQNSLSRPALRHEGLTRSPNPMFLLCRGPS